MRELEERGEGKLWLVCKILKKDLKKKVSSSFKDVLIIQLLLSGCDAMGLSAVTQASLGNRELLET